MRGTQGFAGHDATASIEKNNGALDLDQVGTDEVVFLEALDSDAEHQCKLSLKPQ